MNEKLLNVQDLDGDEPAEDMLVGGHPEAYFGGINVGPQFGCVHYTGTGDEAGSASDGDEVLRAAKALIDYVKTRLG
jgi:hypothetical protein